MNTDRPHHVCPAEHAGWFATPLRKLINNPDRILGGLVDEGDTVVDLGCGPGFFSLPMAEMVGEAGRVVAVDVQEEMLEYLRLRAEKAGLASRIELHHSQPDSIDLADRADFVLAFYMLHEVPDKKGYLRQIYKLLKEDGRFLLAEPLGAVSRKEFRWEVEQAENAGFVCIARPRIAFSRARLFGNRGVPVLSESARPLSLRWAKAEAEGEPDTE